MSGMKHSGGSAITGRNRNIKVAPMTRAVRMALAASVAALALGTSHGALAANGNAPAHGLMQFSPAAVDITPVVDLTVIHAGAAVSGGPIFTAQAIDDAGAGDVVIDNADPITEVGVYDTTTVSGYSSGGNVGITNQAGADLYSGAVYGSAIGIYAYSAIGSASVDNAADIAAISYYGIADGIFAAGVDVDVANSGAIEATSVYGAWAAGIEAEGTDLATVQNDGDIHAAAGYGAAFGIYATGAQVEIGNTGTIEAQGYYATGIEAQSAGDVTVTNDGTIVAGTPYYSVLATGIDAASNGDGALVTVVNNGDVSAQAYYGATGIAATASGVGGSASVTNTGAIYASQHYMYGYGAYGIVASADADSAIDNSGTIEVYSGGVANGAAAFSYAGDASVTNSGDIDVVAAAQAYYGASGIVAFAANGTASVDNSGSVSANSYSYLYASGRAVDAQGQQGVTVNNSGSLYASGANAYGVYALSSGGDVVVNNAAGGEIGFYSYFGGGFGVLGVAEGEADIDNAGTIEGYAYGQSTGVFGFSYAGDVNASNSGSISVTTGGDAALGIFARADYGTASIDNSGDIHASTEGVNGYSGYAAYGAFARGAYAEVSNSGDIVALGTVYATGIAATSLYGTTIDNAGGSIYVAAPGGLASYYGYYHAVGSAFGINAQSAYGDVLVTNASNITAISVGVADVTGINATGSADITVTNSGDIVASTLYGEANGINAATYAHADGTTTVNNSGDITVEAPDSPFGHANGINAFRQYDGDVVVNNSGNIDVKAGGRSYGVYGHTKYGDVSVTNSGDITMLSQTDAQTGIQISAGTFFGGGGDASVINSGDISIYSGYGLAVGIGSIAGAVVGYDLIGNSYINNSGDIDASAQRFAYGIQARGAESATVVNSGDLTVSTTESNGSDYNYSTAGGINVLSFAGGDLAIHNAGDITVSGYEHAYGLYANGGSVGDVSITNSGDVSVDTRSTIARGVFAKSYYGDITVSNGGSIVATGTDAAIASVGIHMSGISGDFVLNNSGDIHASGSQSSIGVLFQNFTGTNTLNNASTGSISAEGDPGTAWAVLGSYYADDIVNNAGEIAGSIYLYNGDDIINNLAGGTLRLDDGQIVMGSSIEGNVFDNAGTIKALGDSRIDMGTGPVAEAALVPSLNPLPLANTGIIDFLDGAADDSLTIVGDLGGNGAINIDLDLSGLASDQLYVDGSMVDGAVQTVNVDLAGLPTGAEDPIAFAHVTGNATAGSFVAGEVLGWNPSNFLDLGVSVTSASSATAQVFSVGVDVLGLNDTGSLAAAVQSGAANMLNSQIGTFKQRMGVNPYGDEGKVLSAFVRTYASEGDVAPAHLAANFGQGGNFAYDQNTWGREIGINANLFGNFHAGLTLGTADGRQRLTGDGIGQNRMSGDTFGAYATWFVPQGYYVDLSYRGMAMDVHPTSAAGTQPTRAETSAWNLEAGYDWQLGGLSIVPQLQYTRTEVEKGSRSFGDQVSFEGEGGTSSRGRLGVEVNKTFGSGDFRWTPYGSLNAIREFDGQMGYTVAGTYFGNTSTKGISTMAELGLGVQKGNWGFNVGASWLDGGAFDSTISGQASIRVSW